MERIAVPRGKRPRVQVSMDDKERAIARIRGGETKAGISRELGVPESTVRGWVKRADQRLAREADEGNESTSPPSLVVHATKLPVKRDHNGELLLPATTMLMPMPMSEVEPELQPQPQPEPVPTPVSVPVPLPLPLQLVQQAADSQLHLNGWLHIFNAGILNFTLIATAAYSRACMRGATDRQSLWQIISDFVDEAGSNVAGQHVAPYRAQYSPAAQRNGRIVAPRLHITAEDDTDDTDAGCMDEEERGL